MEEARYLVLTILVELAVALAILRKTPKAQVGLVVVCVNMITHPIAWYAVLHGGSWLAVEAAVTAVEAVLLALMFPVIRFRAVACAAAMNIASAAVGLILKV